jgi:hypothetical protein
VPGEFLVVDMVLTAGCHALAPKKDVFDATS